MRDVEFKNGPSLAGWVIAAAAALVAFGVAMLVMKFAFMPAAAIATVLFLIVGVILGLPRSEDTDGMRTGATLQTSAPLQASPKVSAPRVVEAPEARTTAAVASAPKSNPVSFLAPVLSGATGAADGTGKSAASSGASSVAAFVAARKPEAMAAARGGLPDDLKQIKGVGPVLEKLLHSLGYFHFDQIAAWTEHEVAWVDENLEGFKGRVTRDDWVPQAKILAAGGTTEFSRRVEDGEVY